MTTTLSTVAAMIAAFFASQQTFCFLQIQGEDEDDDAAGSSLEKRHQLATQQQQQRQLQSNMQLYSQHFDEVVGKVSLLCDCSMLDLSAVTFFNIQTASQANRLRFLFVVRMETASL